MNDKTSRGVNVFYS